MMPLPFLSGANRTCDRLNRVSRVVVQPRSAVLDPTSVYTWFHLPVFQFHGHRPAEDGQLHADLPLGLEDFLDLAFHAGKRAVLDLDAVAPVELAASDGRSCVGRLALPAQHPFHFALGHGRRRLVQAAAHEVADAGRLAEQVQNAVVVLHLHHQVARDRASAP